MQRDIAEDAKFKGSIETGRYFDFETPYGYGGPLCGHAVSEAGQREFLDVLRAYALKHGIVSQFARFHPLLANHEALPRVFETKYVHQTIFMDTSSPERILANMDSKNRNMVRKAVKNGVTIERKPIEEYRAFLPLYEQTMMKDQADAYYFFKEAYFREQSRLRDNACIFYAMKDGQAVSGAMMYYNDRFMHYHLSGTYTEYRKYSPGNLLLCEAARWASEMGIQKFHLGGGIVEDDNLFGFKKQFNRFGRLPFYIGRTIFDEKSYQSLMGARLRLDAGFDAENSRMIQYRA